jgi:hypothetical protein
MKMGGHILFKAGLLSRQFCGVTEVTKRRFSGKEETA